MQPPGVYQPISEGRNLSLALRRNDAATRDVLIKPRREGFVSHMEQWSNVVASRIATTMPRKEEFASHMAQKLNDAALRDVPIKS